MNFTQIQLFSVQGSVGSLAAKPVKQVSNMANTLKCSTTIPYGLQSNHGNTGKLQQIPIVNIRPSKLTYSDVKQIPKVSQIHGVRTNQGLSMQIGNQVDGKLSSASMQMSIQNPVSNCSQKIKSSSFYSNDMSNLSQKNQKCPDHSQMVVSNTHFSRSRLQKSKYGFTHPLQGRQSNRSSFNRCSVLMMAHNSQSANAVQTQTKENTNQIISITSQMLKNGPIELNDLTSFKQPEQIQELLKEEQQYKDYQPDQLLEHFKDQLDTLKVKLQKFENTQANKIARNVAEMVFLKEQLGGVDTKIQQKMNLQLIKSEEALFMVVNSFKPQIERMNLAASPQEMRNLRETAVDDVSKMDIEIERYFKQIRDSYHDTVSLFNKMQQLEQLFQNDTLSEGNTTASASLSLEDYFMERGQDFKQICHEFSTYLYFLSDNDSRANYFDIKDSILMSLWNQIKTSEDFKIFKMVQSVCGIYTDSTFQVMREVEGERNYYDRFSDKSQSTDLQLFQLLAFKDFLRSQSDKNQSKSQQNNEPINNTLPIFLYKNKVDQTVQKLQQSLDCLRSSEEKPTHPENEQNMNLIMQGLDTLHCLIFSERFEKRYINDENGNLMDEMSIKCQVCQSIFENNLPVHNILQIYIKSRINEEAHEIVKSLGGMNLDDEDAETCEYHMDHFQIAFEN